MPLFSYTVIKTDNTVTKHTDVKYNSKDDFFDACKKIIGCRVFEFKRLGSLKMLADEEGKLKQNPQVNGKASHFVFGAHAFACEATVVVGTVVLVDEKYLK